MMSKKVDDPRLEAALANYNATHRNYLKAKRDFEISEIYAKLREEQPHGCENELLEIAEMQYELGIKHG